MQGLLFRCDFGGPTGWGHLVRCSALAQVARSRGFITGLVTRSSVNGLPEELRSGFSHCWEGSPVFPGASFWKACLVEGVSWSAIVVDSYAYGTSDLDALNDIFAGKVPLLVHIHDDPEYLYPEAGLTVCPGFPGEYISSKLVFKGTLCAGLEYLLLRAAFSTKVSIRGRRDSLPRVAVVIGGTDPNVLTPSILKALYSSTQGACIPYVVIPEGLSRDALQPHAESFESCCFFEHLSSIAMADCFASCDYGVTACGGTVYEMASMDLPFIGVSVASNQYFTAKAIQTHWSLPVLDADVFSEGSFADAWKVLVKAFPEGRRPYASIDGQGAMRLVDILSSLLKTPRLHQPSTGLQS
ncbi:MAG TPA: hypothetical protein DIU37_02595 [Opitutae bacterium]|nr:hypothetical protein [Opitutae bacterium]|tara:strand:- start:242 stop:1306 length:1065 start_codon:yes stop_codon:yes gene_type:complete